MPNIPNECEELLRIVYDWAMKGAPSWPAIKLDPAPTLLLQAFILPLADDAEQAQAAQALGARLRELELRGLLLREDVEVFPAAILTRPDGGQVRVVRGQGPRLNQYFVVELYGSDGAKVASVGAAAIPPALGGRPGAKLAPGWRLTAAAIAELEDPTDLITLRVAVAHYTISLDGLRSAIKTKRLRTFRKPGAGTTSPVRVSEAEVAAMWRPRLMPG